jgi:hypothetical protein
MSNSKPRASVGKIAMVQPKPRVPSGTPRVPSGKPAKPDQMKLIKILELIGNDRAYTVLSHIGKTWVIQFKGDAGPTTITINGDKFTVSS